MGARLRARRGTNILKPHAALNPVPVRTASIVSTFTCVTFIISFSSHFALRSIKKCLASFFHKKDSKLSVNLHILEYTWIFQSLSNTIRVTENPIRRGRVRFLSLISFGGMTLPLTSPFLNSLQSHLLSLTSVYDKDRVFIYYCHSYLCRPIGMNPLNDDKRRHKKDRTLCSGADLVSAGDGYGGIAHWSPP